MPQGAQHQQVVGRVQRRQVCTHKVPGRGEDAAQVRAAQHCKLHWSRAWTGTMLHRVLLTRPLAAAAAASAACDASWPTDLLRCILRLLCIWVLLACGYCMHDSLLACVLPAAGLRGRRRRGSGTGSCAGRQRRGQQQQQRSNNNSNSKANNSVCKGNWADVVQHAQLVLSSHTIAAVAAHLALLHVSAAMLTAARLLWVGSAPAAPARGVPAAPLDRLAATPPVSWATAQCSCQSELVYRCPSNRTAPFAQ